MPYFSVYTRPKRETGWCYAKVVSEVYGKCSDCDIPMYKPTVF